MYAAMFEPEPDRKDMMSVAHIFDRQTEKAHAMIWREIARKEIPRAHRMMHVSRQNRYINQKKTTQLAAKESKRWQVRSNKTVKDQQMKARRGMREMLVFWKRNEREERDSRKKAEKEALDALKREEELREAKRQARKLNFLITQTELYSHFVGKKIKTDEIENGTSPAPSEQQQEAPALLHPAGPATVDEIDFDVDDDEALRAAAARSAQNAVTAAQDRARAFDEAARGGGTAATQSNLKLSDINLDDDDMNFTNPTSLGLSSDLPQPKMLNCQLKEYQLKGFNWLANLYEQGINGILADEMGLGKTVQAISVMAYLAESHNMWGPSLVIAPASTLHNWQQELARFAPGLKVKSRYVEIWLIVGIALLGKWQGSKATSQVLVS